MKISIITPVYNAEKTVEKTILSVINQKVDSEVEHIIIDGASSDNTLKIINQYRDHIKIFVSEPDLGVYDAMNKGISLATGDIIGIINSDDWYNENALKQVEEAFKKYPNVSIVHSPVKNYSEEKIFSTFIPGELKYLPFKFTIAHPSCFVKKRVYEQIGLFNLNYSMAADYDFILKAYGNQFKFHCLDTPLASFSLNGMTGTWQNRLKLIQESWQCTDDFVNNYQPEIKTKHKIYYMSRFLRELALIPLKRFDPNIVIKVKGFMRRYFGKLPSDKYGAW